MVLTSFAMIASVVADLLKREMYRRQTLLHWDAPEAFGAGLALETMRYQVLVSSQGPHFGRRLGMNIRRLKQVR